MLDAKTSGEINDFALPRERCAIVAHERIQSCEILVSCPGLFR